VKSNKTAPLAPAVRWAEDLYDDLRDKARHGLEVRRHSFEARSIVLVEPWIADRTNRRFAYESDGLKIDLQRSDLRTNTAQQCAKALRRSPLGPNEFAGTHGSLTSTRSSGGNERTALGNEIDLRLIEMETVSCFLYRSNFLMRCRKQVGLITRLSLGHRVGRCDCFSAGCRVRYSWRRGHL
jgi:hypothetical protein